MKTKITLLSAILIAGNLFAETKWDGTSSAWTNGAGSESNPYLIENPKQLSYLGELVNAGVSTYQDVYFKQTNDFNMDNLDWSPIGSTQNHPFKGHYDGNNKYITKLMPKGGTDCSGLFGYAIGAEFVNMHIKGTLGGDLKRYCGSICAWGNNITLRNCINQASITNKGLYCGGLVGYIIDGSLFDCRNEGAIQAEGHVGGLAGVSTHTINPNPYERCSNSGRITSQTSYSTTISGGQAGGLVAEGGGTFVECFNVGNVSSVCNAYTYAVFAYGICPGSSSTSLTNCFVRANVSAGGWDDKNQTACCLAQKGSMTNCYFAGHLSGSDKIVIHGTNCYYDSDLLGSSSDTGAKTTAQMKSASMPVILNSSSYSCWEIDQNSINSGYPILSFMNVSNTYTVSLNAIHGTVSGAGVYADGESVVLSVTPNGGYEFSHWSDGSTSNPRTITITQDVAYTAYCIKQLDTDSLTLVSHQNGSTIGLSSLASHQIVEYSSNGINWSALTTAVTITLNDGELLYMRGVLSGKNTSTDYTQFSMTGALAVYGNINYLWNYEDLNAPLKDYCGANLFRGCTALLSAPSMPATTLSKGCYNSMFRNCSNLQSSPTLPATELASECYKDMFHDCINLASAPSLPATKLANDCYCSMFYGCNNLSSAPALPAETLAFRCYGNMFKNCTNLISAPELPATTLYNTCYYNMFYGCSHLAYIKCLATDLSASNCITNWVNGVSSSGTFVKNSLMNSWTTGNDGIPNGWNTYNCVLPNKYTVTFVDWDATNLKTEQVYAGSAAHAPTNPTRDGYVFIGWDEDYSKIWSDLTVIAQYEEGRQLQYEVLFTNSQDSSEIYSEYIEIILPNAPEIEGFTFIGWRTISALINDTIQIEAVYRADQPTSVSAVIFNPSNPSQKLIRDGNVYILRGEKVYTLDGRLVR